MNADVRGDVVALDRSGPARVPLAREVQVVGAFTADMTLTDVFLGGEGDELDPRGRSREDTARLT